MTELSPEADDALEQLRLLPGNWRITDFGHWRVQRINGDSWIVGAASSDHWTGYNAACLKGLALVKSMLADQAARQALPRHVFGASPASSAK